MMHPLCIGESEKAVAALFEVANEMKPTIILFGKDTLVLIYII